jgi:hypothetical protein
MITLFLPHNSSSQYISDTQAESLRAYLHNMIPTYTRKYAV